MSSIARAEGNLDGASAVFMVRTIEISIPLKDSIDGSRTVKNRGRYQKYYQGFIATVDKKLGNEKFVANAKPEVVALERKKKADGESKLATLKANLAALRSKSGIDKHTLHNACFPFFEEKQAFLLFIWPFVC